MSDEVAGLAEAPLAGAALVRPLPSVGPLVFHMAGVVREPPRAVPAGERLLSRVQPGVGAQRGPLAERLVADLAGERPLPGVGVEMLLEAGRGREGPVAVLARVPLALC